MRLHSCSGLFENHELRDRFINTYYYILVVNVMDSKNAKQVSVTLPPDLLKKAQAHCRASGKTFSGMVRVAIEKELLNKTD